MCNVLDVHCFYKDVCVIALLCVIPVGQETTACRFVDLDCLMENDTGLTLRTW